MRGGAVNLRELVDQHNTLREVVYELGKGQAPAWLDTAYRNAGPEGIETIEFDSGLVVARVLVYTGQLGGSYEPVEVVLDEDAVVAALRAADALA
jgi:hypothetical protein